MREVTEDESDREEDGSFVDRKASMCRALHLVYLRNMKEAEAGGGFA